MLFNGEGEAFNVCDYNRHETLHMEAPSDNQTRSEISSRAYHHTLGQIPVLASVSVYQ